ncbi:hypothetical protein MLD38_007547 [Melastoma candidum]|uniref:Uncharacterized protein n=1 Tax=Melastoma candidum TaxID=119954 RepID=A0ACB9RR41_9MYRT|nr:hypothetical protein MLD38_007547 [Melastoma candidum]
MGNAIGRKRTAKVMKITGETFKLRTPVLAGDVLKDHPGKVLLESESVKHFGVRAKPLRADRNLEPGRLYFLVELPSTCQAHETANGRFPRRVSSGITMGAKDRLESLMLARRSISDLSIVTAATTSDSGGKPVVLEDGEAGSSNNKRVRIRLPKAEVERLMRSSRDEAEAAERIVNLYIVNRNRNVAEITEAGGNEDRQPQRGVPKIHEKRVSFLVPGIEGAVQIAVA